MLDFMLLSGFLLLGVVLREKVSIFQKSLFPPTMIGGIIGFVIVNWVFNPYSANIGTYIVHMLEIMCGALGLMVGHRLMTREKAISKDALNMAFSVNFVIPIVFLATMGFAALAMGGWGIPGVGILTTFGFIWGPGQALALGGAFAKMGWKIATQVGLFTGVLGYFFATIGGVGMINIGWRKGLIKLTESFEKIPNWVFKAVISDKKERDSLGETTMTGQAIDTLAFTLALVFGTFALGYGLANGISTVLVGMGGTFARIGQTLGAMVFAWNIVVGILVGILIGVIGYSHAIGEGALDLVTGVCTDYMIVAAFCSISLTVIMGMLPLLLGVTIFAGFLLMAIFYFIIRPVYNTYNFERIMPLYGNLTGQVPSALALLRILDPRFDSEVFADYIGSMLICVPLFIPLIMFSGLPMVSWATGNPTPAITFIVMLVAYIVGSAVILWSGWLEES